MRSLWLAALVAACVVMGGWILVQARPPEEQAALAEQAAEEAQEAAVDLGLAEAPEPEREPATFYRYTDASGTMRFVASLAEVPAKHRASARPVSNDRIQRAPTHAAAPAKRAPRTRDPIVKLEERAMEHEVIVYTTSWCGWCRKTLAYLTQQGVPFENRDIEAEEMWRDELLEKTGGTSIPVVEIDGQIVRGYDPQRMAQLLRSS